MPNVEQQERPNSAQDTGYRRALNILRSDPTRENMWNAVWHLPRGSFGEAFIMTEYLGCQTRARFQPLLRGNIELDHFMGMEVLPCKGAEEALAFVEKANIPLMPGANRSLEIDRQLFGILQERIKASLGVLQCHLHTIKHSTDEHFHNEWMSCRVRGINFLKVLYAAHAVSEQEAYEHTLNPQTQPSVPKVAERYQWLEGHCRTFEHEVETIAEEALALARAEKAGTLRGRIGAACSATVTAIRNAFVRPPRSR